MKIITKKYKILSEILQNTTFMVSLTRNTWLVPKETKLKNVTVIASEGTSINICKKKEN